MLEMTADVRDAIIADAVRRRPNEACAMLSAAGPDQVADGFHSVRNEAASPTRFRLDPAEMLAIEAEVDAADRLVIAIVHSHPTTSATPSRTDIEDSHAYDPTGTFHQLVVSLAAAEPSLRSFRIVDGVVTEEPVLIAEPEPTAHDQAGAVAAVAQLPRRTPPAD